MTATPSKNNFQYELFYNFCDKIPKEEDFREESAFGFICFVLFSVLQSVGIIGEILEGGATCQLREKELAQAIRSHCQPSVTWFLQQGSTSKFSTIFPNKLEIKCSKTKPVENSAISNTRSTTEEQ